MSPAELKEYGGVFVALLVAAVIGLEGPLRKLMERHPVVRQVAEAEATTQDVVTAVRLAVAESREKDAQTFKIALDRSEARELHLTGQNEELLRLAATRDAYHEREMLAARSLAHEAQEEAREARFELQKAGFREKALQESSMAQDKAHMNELNTARRDKERLRLQLEDYVRRYGDKGGRFTATDVLGGDSS